MMSRTNERPAGESRPSRSVLRVFSVGPTGPLLAAVILHETIQSATLSPTFLGTSLKPSRNADSSSGLGYPTYRAAWVRILRARRQGLCGNLEESGEAVTPSRSPSCEGDDGSGGVVWQVAHGHYRSCYTCSALIHQKRHRQNKDKRYGT